MEIDTSTDFGARVARHLEDDQVVWLTTVGPDGTPQPSPVWFLWDGDTALVRSQPSTPKLRNIEQRPRVSLHFNCTPNGGDVVILTGDAWVEAGAAPANAGSRLRRQIRRRYPEYRHDPGRRSRRNIRSRSESGRPRCAATERRRLQRTASISENSSDPISSEARISAVTPTATTTKRQRRLAVGLGALSPLGGGRLPPVVRPAWARTLVEGLKPADVAAHDLILDHLLPDRAVVRLPLQWVGQDRVGRVESSRQILGG